MGLEYELKYRAEDIQQAAIRDAFPGEETLLQMETTYYDTPDRALSGRKYTLRRRMENGVPVCTLKAPAAGQGRGEWETVCAAIEDALPTLTAMSGIHLPICEGLIPVCGARFTRIAKLLIREDFTAELALDTGVLVGGGREIPLCEVELELKSGSREALDAFGREFRQTFGLQKEPKSKYRRALALARGENVV